MQDTLLTVIKNVGTDLNKTITAMTGKEVQIKIMIIQAHQMPRLILKLSRETLVLQCQINKQRFKAKFSQGLSKSPQEAKET